MPSGTPPGPETPLSDLLEAEVAPLGRAPSRRSVSPRGVRRPPGGMGACDPPERRGGGVSRVFPQTRQTYVRTSPRPLDLHVCLPSRQRNLLDMAPPWSTGLGDTVSREPNRRVRQHEPAGRLLSVRRSGLRTRLASVRSRASARARRVSAYGRSVIAQGGVSVDCPVAAGVAGRAARTGPTARRPVHLKP